MPAQSYEFDLHETELLELIFIDPEGSSVAVERVAPEQFAAGPLRQIFKIVGGLLRNGREATYVNVMLSLDRPFLKNIATHLLDEAIEKKHSQDEYNAVNAGVLMDRKKQLEWVIQGFDRAKFVKEEVARFTASAMTDEEELALLEQLLEQTRQRECVPLASG